ncbi:MAG: hypothetical protein AEth_00994 [Candidatus Argoarchaeum ethanivorans]|uniref:Guanylate kinase-like domain-containing protein n=1 Tax=Candidatus Argoarchaeum ethanivorans TaxID=2608793 RepID=A0A8B3S374_9EURY|nr:MAG: hypothetical protein AEth_00994 [Candidatus Argoarchaeum ethanivorans]
MVNLFLIDGASGTGKTDLIEHISEKYSSRDVATIVQKFTTREHRPEEIDRRLHLDLMFSSRSEFDEQSKNSAIYSYNYCGEKYGFYKATVDEALASYQNVFIIVRDRITIQQIVDDYPKVCTVPVFIYSDNEKVIEGLKKDGYGDSDIEFRLSRQELVWDDYLRQSDLYQEVIINNSNKRDFHRLIDKLLKKYSFEQDDVLVISHCERFPIIKPLIGFKKEMQSHVEQYPYERNVFLMMKFRPTNERVYRFIENNLKQNGFNCVRSDQREWDITKNLYNPIAALYCCKYGIALFDKPEDGNNFSPNVAYELGMMQLQGKNCLILRRTNLPDMPFDLIKDLHKYYSEDLELKEIVFDWIKKIKGGNCDENPLPAACSL